jgi:hypothetical protein
MSKTTNILPFVGFLFVYLFSQSSVSAQEKEHYWIKTDSLYKYVTPSASMQLWSTYTTGEKMQLEKDGPLVPLQDRLNFLARRARIGFKGKPYKNLSYALVIQYDNLGKDKFSAVRGGTNTGQFGVLDAYLGWKITKNDLATLTLGYFHPQISRECITGDILVNSLDKSPSQGYIRQHIVGKGYGRTTGINVGGLKKAALLTINYNLGLFNNLTTAEDQKKYPETTGKFWSPLYAGRVTFSIGDPDIKSYAINYGMNNYFNKRKGITIGFNATHQGKTEIFSSNEALGVDVLLNYSNFNLDAELFWLKRVNNDFATEFRTGHIRAGYNVILAQKFFFEPTIAVALMDGGVGTSAIGKDKYYDMGINWYLNKQNYRIGAHYILQDGEGNNGYTDGITFQKGNYFALAMILII